MRGVVNPKKYLGVSLKSGEYKQYLWDDIDFDTVHESLVVRTLDGELLFCVPLTNIEYYERIEE